jgi:hypothetical protein
MELYSLALLSHSWPLCMQQVVLEYRDDGALVTGDEDPVVLGRAVVESLVAAGGKPPVPGRLMRFSIGPGGLQVGSRMCTLTPGRPA